MRREFWCALVDFYGHFHLTCSSHVFVKWFEVQLHRQNVCYSALFTEHVLFFSLLLVRLQVFLTEVRTGYSTVTFFVANFDTMRVTACYPFQVMYAVPVTGVSIGAYLIPVYFMSRLRQDDDFRPFGLYACIMYLHTLAWRAIAKLAVFVFPTPGAMAFPLAIIIVISFLTSGYSIHPTQISEVFNWSRWISPTHYAFHQLNHLEFHGIEKIDCQKIPVQVGGLPILTRYEHTHCTVAHRKRLTVQAA